MSATENLEKHGVPTSEICRDIAYRQYVGSSFHVVRPLPPYHCRRCRGSGDSGPRETSRWRKLFARCVLGFFIEGYLFPHPSSSIRMAEIKRQINVSRADGPNVRTENPILACRTVRLVRVSSLLSITLSPPSASLSPTLRALSLSIPRPRTLSSLYPPAPSFYYFYFLIRSPFPFSFSSSSSFFSSSFTFFLSLIRSRSRSPFFYFSISLFSIFAYVFAHP